MRNTILKTIGCTALAIFTLIIFAQFKMSAQEANSENKTAGQTTQDVPERGNERLLEGSWNVTVTVRNCQTGAAVATFSALNTFMKGGTMQEYSTGNAPLPRGPGHGVWSHKLRQSYTYAFQFFRFNADGTFAGLTRARRDVEFGSFNSTYSATATIEVFNPTGVLVATACATETASRFE